MRTEIKRLPVGPQVLSREQMEKLTTKRLMAYRKRMYAVLEYGDDLYLHKQHPLWIQTMDTLKSILGTREHVPKKWITGHSVQQQHECFGSI